MSKSDSEKTSNEKKKKGKKERKEKPESEEKKSSKGFHSFCRIFLWQFYFLILVIAFLCYFLKNDFANWHSMFFDQDIVPKEIHESANEKGIFGPSVTEINKRENQEDHSSQDTSVSENLSFQKMPLEIQIIRIASWNLYPFDLNKLADVNRSQKIAQLFQEFDIIAVQGIRSKNQTILEGMVYLIKQNGGNYDYACSSTVSQSAEYLTYFYNKDRIELDRETLIDLSDSEGRLTYPVLVASFRPLTSNADRAFTFSLANVWIDPHREPKDRDALLDIYQTIRKTTGRFGIAEDDVILLGSFNASILEIGNLSRATHLVAVHLDKATHWNGTSFDNICFNEKATVEYIERYGVVHLSHYFNISDEEAQRISDHRPIWADFSVFEGGQ